MKMYKANIGELVVRFYLMMAVVIAAVFMGVSWLAILALPILMSAMVGISFKGKKKDTTTKTYTEKKVLPRVSHETAA